MKSSRTTTALCLFCALAASLSASIAQTGVNQITGSHQQEVTLKEDTPLDVKSDGKVIGSILAKSGTVVKVIRVDGSILTVEYNGNQAAINDSKVDLSPVRRSESEAFERETQSPKPPSIKLSAITSSIAWRWGRLDFYVWQELYYVTGNYKRKKISADEYLDKLKWSMKTAQSPQYRASLQAEIDEVEREAPAERAAIQAAERKRISDNAEALQRAEEMGLTQGEYEALITLFGPMDDVELLIDNYEKTVNKSTRPFAKAPPFHQLLHIYQEFALETLGVKQEDSSSRDEGRFIYWKTIYNGGSKDDARHAEEMANLKGISDDLKSTQWELSRAKQALEEIKRNQR